MLSDEINQFIKEKNNEMVEKYIKQMNAIEIKSLEIAIDHLESSFDIERSIGYLKFLEKK
tara:strand:+ start:1949 stop:2128 length:180 start_codon:yes stop_codon:yes gene_type:complete